MPVGAAVYVELGAVPETLVDAAAEEAVEAAATSALDAQEQMAFGQQDGCCGHLIRGEHSWMQHRYIGRMRGKTSMGQRRT